MKREIKKLINYVLIAVLVAGSIVFGTMSNDVEVLAKTSSLSGYKVSGYPKFPKVTQKNYVIVKEGCRSGRIEIIFFNIGNKTSKSCLLWNHSLDAAYGDVVDDVKYYLSEEGKWVYMECGNGRISDYASDVLVSSMNVVNQNEEIVVKATPIKYIKFSQSKYNLTKGDSITLKYKTNIKGKVSFSSSKKTVVSVNSKGKIKAKKAGKATITVKTTSGKKATCKITVK